MDKKLQPGLNAHLVISVTFGAIIVLIFVYSSIYRGENHPVPAYLTEKTGLVPPSKGLSGAFSELVRGNIHGAVACNAHAIRIFFFFLIQLLARLFIVLAVLKNWAKPSVLLISDVVFSIFLFIYCFYPFIDYTFRTLLS